LGHRGRKRKMWTGILNPQAEGAMGEFVVGALRG
jgi:hypothetical protein